jgi:acyl carrier protein
MAYKAPQTEMERLIARVLQEVLELEQVGSEDNFFDLGGNSLLLARVHEQLQEHLGREIHAVEIFNHPTVESLAAHLDGGADGAGAPERPMDDRREQLKTGRNRLLQRRRQQRR